MPFDASTLSARVQPARVAHLQAGAIPIRRRNGAMEVLLVTTKGRGVWIVPRGWPSSGYPDCESARREAFEEAGVMGRVEPYSLGAFTYWKGAGKKRTYFQVHAFVLHVDTVLASWPERDRRKRCWFTPESAAKLVANRDLGELVLQAAYGIGGEASLTRGHA